MKPAGTSRLGILGRFLAPFGLIFIIMAVESSVMMALGRIATQDPRPVWPAALIGTGVGLVICLAGMAALRVRGYVRFSWIIGQTSLAAWAACLGLGLGMLTTLLGAVIPGELPDLVAGYSFLQIAALVVIGRSVYEELLFRGLLQGFLTPLLSRRWRFFGHDFSLAAVVGAVAFGLIHFSLLSLGGDFAPVSVIVAAGFLLGLLAGYYRDRTGSMIHPIVAHVCANLGGYFTGIMLGPLA